MSTMHVTPERLQSVDDRLNKAMLQAEAFSEYNDTAAACRWWLRVSRLNTLRGALVVRLKAI